MNKEENFVLVVGSSNMDLNMYSERFPTPGETVTGGSFSQSFGGKGANQAVASTRSGSKTIFIGKIGNDTFGNQMLEQLAKEGIDTSRIIVDPNNASGVAMILIDSNGQNMISVAPGANKQLVKDDLKNSSSIIEKAKVVILQMEIQLDVISEICRITYENDGISILNPAPFKEISLEVLKKINITTPNENELFKLHRSLDFSEHDGTLIEKVSKATQDLHSKGLNTIVVTLGDKGCYISEGVNKNQIHILPIEVDAVDAVGAGDCFNGVLASRLSKGDSIQTAAKYANIAASIAVTRKGAQDSIPLWNEIESKYSEWYD